MSVLPVSHRWTRAAVTALASTALLLGLPAPAPATAAPTTAATATSTSAPTTTTTTTTTTATTTTTTATTTAAPTTLVVRPGDTLTDLARAAGVPGGWPALYAANRDAVGASPDRLLPGTVLALPAAAAAPSSPATTYLVQPGDTLRDIAAGLGVDGGWPVLLEANREVIGADPDLLRVGAQLVVPAAAVSAQAAPTSPTPTPAPTTPPTPAPTTAPTPAPSSAASPGASAPAAEQPAGPAPAEDGQGSGGVPGWVLWPLLAVAVLGLAALVGDPLLALARRTRQRRVQPAASSAAAVEPVDEPVVEPVDEPVVEPALRLVPAPAAPVVRVSAVGTVVHVEEHPALLVSYCQRDDLVLVMAPRGQEAEAVLDIARVVLPERAYRAVEQQLPARLGERRSMRATG